MLESVQRDAPARGGFASRPVDLAATGRDATEQGEATLAQRVRFRQERGAGNTLGGPETRQPGKQRLAEADAWLGTPVPAAGEQRRA